MAIRRVRLVMTATDAAAELGLSRQSINKAILAGRLKSARRLDGRQYVIRRDEIEAIKAGKHEEYVEPEDDL